MLATHFAVNTKESFFSTLQINFEIHFCKSHARILQNLLYHLLAVAARSFHRIFDHPKAHGHRVTETQVLQIAVNNIQT